MIRKIYGVGEVTGYLHDLLEGDPLLSALWVRGEIFNFKHHTSGHLYFTLKDDRSAMRTVMFRSRASRLNFLPDNGIRVLVRGYISIYERDGVYQLYAEEMEPDGVGALYQAFCRLREKLAGEGLFDAGHKRPLPFLPRRVGVVTSASGAAWHDLLTVMRRRYPGLPIVLAPAAVQGREAPAEICAALDMLNQRDDIDLIIAGRGGGSLEELWAFNTEEVARAIYRSRIPVISAVGHETDVTIADLVADLRAPTPSAAAELAVPELAELKRNVGQRQERLFSALRRYRLSLQTRLTSLGGGRMAGLLQEESSGRRERLRLLNKDLSAGVGQAAQRWHARLEAISGRLEALSPLAILRRGYSLCCHAEGGVISSYTVVSRNEKIRVVLSDGRLQCVVTDVKGDEVVQRNR